MALRIQTANYYESSPILVSASPFSSRPNTMRTSYLTLALTTFLLSFCSIAAGQLSDTQPSLSDVEDDSIPSLLNPESDQPKKSFSVPGNLYVTESVRLAAKEPGIVEHIIELGEKVDAGQTIVALDDELLKAQIVTAEKELGIAQLAAENDIDLRFAKVSSEVNQRVLERSKAANRQYAKAISKTEIERLRLELERSKLSAEQAARTGKTNILTQQLKRAQVDMAEIQLASRTITAPNSGLVTEVLTHKGEWVNAGQPVARIVSTDKLRFTGFVDSREILPSAISDKATLEIQTGTGPSSKLERSVKVTFINPEIDPASGLFEIRAEVDNSDQQLFAGLKSKLKIVER